ncbi:kynurenine aminotransferase-like [Phymastichus coffea]|uniref:kynurenine aminotransferase-like n=1 Tax=Phymastichus coffea TaxID=108790 RepID=UPI00273CE056|nr:kynurenine aminotransferase-like [Phymastichus coffea]
MASNAHQRHQRHQRSLIEPSPMLKAELKHLAFEYPISPVAHRSPQILSLVFSGDAAVLKNLANKFDFPSHIAGTNRSAANELQPFAAEYSPVDLGIDYLDDEAPAKIQHALANATLFGGPAANQVSVSDGLLRLRRAISTLYSRLIGRELDAQENVVITAGATEAVNSAFSGHTSPGDEWVVIEPAYTMYLPMIKMARGVPRFTSLKLRKHRGRIDGEDWVLDKAEMESLFSEKTKGILLNNPLNPIGKVYTREELEFIGSLAVKYNTIVVCDEAHEWVTHKPHIRIASLPGMFERTITVGSSSKSFSVSGWRIGWAYGPKEILNHVKTVHANTLDSAPTPQQQAVASAFEDEIRDFGSPDSYFVSHRRHVQWQRNFLTKAFADVGMRPVVSDGGYCMLVDWTPLRRRFGGKVNGAMDFVKWMIRNVGVLGLPMSSYYGDAHKHMGENFARYCFHKKNDTLIEAARRLKKLNK